MYAPLHLFPHALEVGMGTCVILLNARLEGAKYASDVQRDFFLDAFEPGGLWLAHGVRDSRMGWCCRV